MFEKWKILKSDLVFSALPWFEVYKQTVKLPSGTELNDYYQIHQPDYVEIVAVNGRQEIQGIWHYKHGPRRINLGLPAGYIEKNEQPLEAAKRELAEECQLVSEEWSKLGEFVLEGNRSTAKAYIFLAMNCQKAPEKQFSDDIEEYKLEWLGVDEWKNHVMNGKVAVIGAATSILLAFEELKNRGIV